jgi:hypothetical protein
VKREWVAAERVEEVRAAAEGWKRAGAVAPGTFAEIVRRYPEPRPLPAPLWRLLTAFFVTAVLLLLTGALFIALQPRTRPASVLLCFLAAACVAATEFQENSPRLALRGGAGATAFWGMVFLLVGLGLFLVEETLFLREPAFLNILLLASLVLWSLAAWRWGSTLSTILAAASLFLLLGRVPSGRLLWAAVGIAMTLVFERFLDRPSVSPSHRRSAAALVVCGLLAVYEAVNLSSLDMQFVELLRWEQFRAAPPLEGASPERIIAILGTALVPLATVAWGIRSRRTFVLDTGLVLFALSLVTLRYYVHVAFWVVLACAGGGLVLSALALNRWLARAPSRERRSFTAELLFADEARLRVLELVPVVAAHAPAAHAPEARPLRPPVEPDFQGGGGSFGGGGAGGAY